MKVNINILIPVLFVLIGASAAMAQEPPPSIDTHGQRTIGQATISYAPKKDQTMAYTTVYLQGSTPGLSEKRDAISLMMNYRVAGPKAIEPESLNITLTMYTFSNGGLKYKDDHKLSFYLDDKELRPCDAQQSCDTAVILAEYDRGLATESFGLGISYQDFLKIVNAKKVQLQLGQTKVELSREAIDALKDLHKTVGSEAGWAFAEKLVRSPGTFAVPANEAHTPRGVQLRARYLDGNDPVGDWSSIVTVQTIP